jgi:uncharacterized protein YjbI with pentapeptide repeats
MLLFPSADLSTYLSLGIAALAIVASVLTTGLTLRHQRKQSELARIDTEEQSLNERFASATEQLGHEKAAVRLSGIHALVRLTDDWEPQRQAGIDVLCAYLRMPYDPESAPQGEKEVRQTIIRLIGNHLRPDARFSWSKADLDFTGATFDGGDFSGAEFSGLLVSFHGAAFTAGEVSFAGATFNGGLVDFSGAAFSGELVDFSDTTFSGRWVQFFDAMFGGGKVDFNGAAFTAGDVGFVEATFSNVWVDFTGATFSGGSVYFTKSTFGGEEVTFIGATFSDGGSVYFWGAAFNDGVVQFTDAAFSGGLVDFTDATFGGGTVSIASVEQWTHPPKGLSSEAPGLTLPEWGTEPEPLETSG